MTISAVARLITNIRNSRDLQVLISRREHHFLLSSGDLGRLLPDFDPTTPKLLNVSVNYVSSDNWLGGNGDKAVKIEQLQQMKISYHF